MLNGITFRQTESNQRPVEKISRQLWSRTTFFTTMPTSPTANLAKLLDGLLYPIGFSRSGQKWERRTPETICRVSLQKSRNQYHLNFDVSVIQLNALGPTGEPVWHIIGSMFSPNVQEKVEWEKCLNVLKTEVSGKPRERRLIEIMQGRIIPLLESFQSLEGIRELLMSGQLRGMGVRTELQNLTGYRA